MKTNTELAVEGLQNATDEVLRLRALVKEQDETIKENMRAMQAGIRYRIALESLYEAANTKDRVSIDDLEAAYRALNR